MPCQRCEKKKKEAKMALIQELSKRPDGESVWTLTDTLAIIYGKDRDYVNDAIKELMDEGKIRCRLNILSIA